MKPILIDGTMGEGGGQILRSSLALSMLSARPVHLSRIRGKRRKPGLARQHLTGVLAAAEVCGAQVSGASLRSDRLEFRPGPVQAGTYRFSVGTAGSTALVLQTILPALLTADAPSEVVVEGGTHASMAPTAHFLKRSFLPALSRWGGHVELELERWGFYPAGGGAIRARITPAAWRPAELLERGPIARRHVVVALSNLPVRIARDELRTLLGSWELEGASNEVVQPESPGPGNAVWAEIDSPSGCTVVTAFGSRGVSSKRVAKDLLTQLREPLVAEVPVGVHLADQLLLPMALAGGGAIRTLPPSLHTTTNITVIERFLPVAFTIEEDSRRSVIIRCRAR